MTRAGIQGAGQRRLVALAVIGLGLLNIVLAAVRHPPLWVAAFRGLLPHATVVGSRYVVLLAGLTLLTTVRGLLHGKQQAWRIAAIAATVSLLAYPLKRTDVVGAAVAGSTLALLLLSVRRFPARSDPRRVSQGIRWLLIGAAGVFLYGFAGLFLMDSEFRHPVNTGQAIDNALRLLFVLPAMTIEPATRHGAWFINSVRVLATLVLAAGIWSLLHPVIHRATVAPAERQRVRAILDAYATTPLAYFHLLDDKHYFFAEHDAAVISYKVVGTVAVALGEPIGRPDACRAVARAFVEHCELNGWAFCFYQVTPAGAAALGEIGLRALKVGEEAIVPLDRFTLQGPVAKSLRNVMNRLRREGYAVERLTQPLSPDAIEELRDVSDSWLAQGGHRERTFTLGAFDPDYLRATEVFVVRAPGGRIDAFVNVLPSFRAAIGNFDLMRRRADAPNGAIDFLFVHLIERFKALGYTGMSLGFAPLSGIEGDGAVPRALRLLYHRAGRAFNFQGLRAFKDKWSPEWEPRYLVYRSELRLPELALAVARCGELPAPAAHAGRRPPRPRLRWKPAG
ncbi:MAG: phosphatidylglycerol lysyltransferase domain-containing protein [Dehalococcoidia bacterium]